MQQSFTVTTDRDTFTDITEKVATSIQETEVDQGICHVFVHHTTCGICINENEPHLLQDLHELLEHMAPQKGAYHHNDGNGHAHLQTIILGNNVSMPITKNRLALGTWQRLLLRDPDGPRQRQIRVTVYSA